MRVCIAFVLQGRSSCFLFRVPPKISFLSYSKHSWLLLNIIEYMGTMLLVLIILQ